MIKEIFSIKNGSIEMNVYRIKNDSSTSVFVFSSVFYGNITGTIKEFTETGGGD